MAHDGVVLEANLNPKRLEYVSPSSLGSLEECFLRVAFGTDPTHARQVPQGPSARLGTACHAVLDRVSKGELTGVPEAARQPRLADIWKEEAAKQEAGALASPLERHLGPIRRWPWYALNRARVLRRAAGIVERMRQPEEQPRGGRRGSVQTEKYYRSYGGKLRGRADVVYSSGAQTVIQDYKTGSIYEESPGKGVTLRERYRRQLLLYAAMHHDETGTWPEEGVVAPLVGENVSVRLSPAEASQEADNALRLLEKYNAQLEKQHDSYSHLASPSAETCRFCGFKAFCGPFWKEASAAWDWPRSAAIAGRVVRVRTTGGGEGSAEISTEHGTVGRGVRVLRYSRPSNLVEGQHVRAVNLLTTGKSPDLFVTEYSEVRTVSSPDGGSPLQHRSH